MSDDAPTLKRLLIIVTADPARSGRLAEAIRLAAGIGAWQKVAITVFVGGEAAAGLHPGDGRFIDEDNIVEFLPILVERGQPPFLEAGHPLIGRDPELSVFPRLDLDALAELAARQDYVMRF